MKYLITKIDLNDKIYGGRVYENQIVDLLKDTVDFKRVFLMKYRFKIFNLPWIFYLFIKYRFFYKGTLLLTNQTTWLAGKNSRNIVVVHHIDDSYPRSITSFYQRFCDKMLYYNRTRFSQIITVAEYWRKQLERNGFKNISVIYNSFDVNLYSFSFEEIERFKKKYGFIGKPLIYLGNSQKKKGVIEAYNSLKGLNAYFVTSGNKDVELPIPNLILSFDEYRLLLAASDVVITMSLFNEGWNRVAHEAVLSGTPVIGSGKGGMNELLRMTGQIICTSFQDLPYYVNNILKNKPSINNTTIKRFSLQYFKESWEKVLAEK